MILKFEDFTKPQKKAFEQVLEDSYNVYKISETLPDYLYVCFRALTADVPNMNWDQFDTEELNRYDSYLKQKVYETFNGKSIFTNHQSQKVENSIGVIFDSYFNTKNANDKFVEIIFGIDRRKSDDIARGVETSRLKSGSMGCQISHSLCSYCQHPAYTEADFCSHLKNYRGQLLDSIRVAERLRGVNFQEYSIVTVGADPKAKLRYIVSSVIDYKRLPKAAENSDIFDLMKIIATEIKNASLNERIKLSKNLDEVVSTLEGRTHIILNDQKPTSLDDDINKKLSILFNYVRETQERDISGPVHRATKSNGTDLKDLVGRDVEIDEQGRVFVL